jgi:hypothetical protein
VEHPARRRLTATIVVIRIKAMLTALAISDRVGMA